MLLFRFIKRTLIDSYKTIRLVKFYSIFSEKKEIPKQKIIISMIDGRMHHGGFSDRLFGIISAFKYCQEHNIDFRINWIYPFKLESFLEPNEYDWRIESTEISYNLWQSRPKYVSMFYLEIEMMNKHAKRKLKFSKQQLHLYSNAITFTQEEFRKYFNILFKKSKVLEDEISKNLRNIGDSYVSITFRFQQLLGDLKETGFQTLESVNARNELINKCLSCVKNVYHQQNKRILVTSDSSTFLSIVSKEFSFVYTIPGNIVHMDYVSENDNIDINTHLKSFVDLFMLANAQKIFLADIKPLYKSAFPKLASWIYGKEFYLMNEMTIKKES